MQKLKIGVIGTSKKIDERRLPIHPNHLLRIPEILRKQLIFEEGYGAPFGIPDEEIAALTGGIDTRHNLLANIGTVIINKPVLSDLEELCEGGTLWGYVHNEMAGYCAVIHALQLKGIDGHYGNQRKIIIFGFGAVSRGAVYALKAHGFRDITICVQRPDHEVREEVLDCHYVRIQEGNNDEPRMIVIEHDGTVSSLSELIRQSDIIVNGVFQDTANPTNFIIKEEASILKPDSLIIDISCDEGMGFFFAKPTTFKKPMFKYNRVDYYAVDHTPSYLWESATRSISAALIVYLSTVMEGREAWQKNETIRQAINIDKGVVINKAILAFQNRSEEYPHQYFTIEEKAVLDKIA